MGTYGALTLETDIIQWIKFKMVTNGWSQVAHEICATGEFLDVCGLLCSPADTLGDLVVAMGLRWDVPWMCWVPFQREGHPQ